MPAMWRRARCQGAAPLQRPGQLLLGVPHSPRVSCHILAGHSSVPSQQCGKWDCPVNSHGKSLCAQEGTWLCPCSWGQGDQPVWGWAHLTPVGPGAALESPGSAWKLNHPCCSPESETLYVAASMSRSWNLKCAWGERFTGCSVHEHGSAGRVFLIDQCTVIPVAFCIIHLPQH